MLLSAYRSRVLRSDQNPQAARMNDVVRGHLLPPGDAPPTGERSEDIARVGTAVVEQILSGALTAPVN